MAKIPKMPIPLSRLQMVCDAYDWEQQQVSQWKNNINNNPPALNNPVSLAFAKIWNAYFDEVSASNGVILGFSQKATVSGLQKQVDAAADRLNKKEHKRPSVKSIHTKTGNYKKQAAYFKQFDNLVCLEVIARDFVENYLLHGTTTCDLSACDLVSKGKKPKSKAPKKKKG